MAQVDDSYRTLFYKLTATDRLKLIDWGLGFLNQQRRSDLLELIDTRHGTRSIERQNKDIDRPTSCYYAYKCIAHSDSHFELDDQQMSKEPNALPFFWDNFIER